MEKTFDYEQLLQMLRSHDEENVILGLSVIDNASFEENFIKMIYLKKEANVDYDFWLAHAPESGKKLRQIFLKANLSISEPIGHYDVSKVLAHTQATESETEFFLLKGFSQFMEAIGIDKYCPEVKNYKIKIEKND